MTQIKIILQLIIGQLTTKQQQASSLNIKQ